MKTKPAPRPDSWLESLAVKTGRSDPMDDLVAKLASAADQFSVRNPIVLLGEGAGQPALAGLAERGNFEIAALDSFSLGIEDIGPGAAVRFPDAGEWRKHDGVVCLDTDPASYLNAIEFCFRNGVDLPILTDFDALPAQASQLPVYGEELRSDIYVYNYFTKLYRIKDPLQLVWRLHWDDGSTAWGARLMGPNETLCFSARELVVSKRPGAGTLIWHVHNPAFARVPNSRFRGYGDYHNGQSIVCAHGDELEPKRAEAGGWFDCHVALFGGDNDVVFVVRNDMSEPNDIAIDVSAQPTGGGEVLRANATVPAAAPLASFSMKQLFGAGAQPVRTRFIVQLMGRTYRLEWNELRQTRAGETFVEGNHGSTNDPSLRKLCEPGARPDPVDPAIMDVFVRMQERDVLALPYPLPVLPGDQDIQFEFSAGKFLPRIETVDVAAFDADGALIERCRIDLPKDLGYVDPQELPFWKRMAGRGGLLLISPPYVEQGLVTYQNCREDLWVRAKNKRTGDSDITELQLHNRNLRGYTLPIGFGQAPYMIRARTELMIRYRTDKPFNTHLVVINASPELGFDRSARAELEFNQADGTAWSIDLEIPPQAYRDINIAELLSEDTKTVGAYGFVRVVSDTAALCGYTYLTNEDTGAVGLQHLLGA